MINSQGKGRKIVVILSILCLAIIVRIAGFYLRETIIFNRPFLVFGPTLYQHFRSDEMLYNYTAKSILEGEGYSINFAEYIKERNNVKENGLSLADKYFPTTKARQDNPDYRSHYLFPPLYPMFLAFSYKAFGVNTLAYFIPQLLFGAFSCLFVYLIAGDLFGDKAAVLSGLMVAMYPDLVFWTYQIRVETLGIFLLLLGFLLLLRGNLKGQNLSIYTGGVIFGLAVLAKITFLFFLPIILIWQWWFLSDKQKGFLMSLKLLLIFMLILFPWCLRNYFVFNEFTPLTTETGTILLTYMPMAEFGDSANSFIGQYWDYIINNGQVYSIQVIDRAVKFLGPITPQMDPFAKVYKLISWIIVFPLSFFGMFMALRNNWKNASLLILFIIYYICLHAASYVDDGLVYRYPIQPLLCIFAAYGFWQIFDRYSGKGPKAISGYIK